MVYIPNKCPMCRNDFTYTSIAMLIKHINKKHTFTEKELNINLMPFSEKFREFATHMSVILPCNYTEESGPRKVTLCKIDRSLWKTAEPLTNNEGDKSPNTQENVGDEVEKSGYNFDENTEEYIMRSFTSIVVKTGEAAGQRRYVCPVPGCRRMYKNANGLKYHAANGHGKRGNRVLSTTYKKKCDKQKKHLSKQEMWKKWLH